MHTIDGIDYLLVKHTERGRAVLDLPGEWQREPDKAHWIDAASNLDCLIVRGPTGALCGYVAVPPGHPLYGQGYDECAVADCGEEWCYSHTPNAAVEVHGGLTYADFCAEGREDGICRIPAPGRPDKVWWFGFDCSHSGDLAPWSLAAPYGGEIYRDFAYVTAEVGSLAQQIAAVSA